MGREALLRRRRELYQQHKERENARRKGSKIISKERVLQASESCSKYISIKSMNLVYMNGELLTALMPRLVNPWYHEQFTLHSGLPHDAVSICLVGIYSFCNRRLHYSKTIT